MYPISVLIVDNNPTFLGAATRFLKQQAGDSVTVVGTATGSESGLNLTLELKPQVVLLDLSMPGLSGLDTIPLLRQRSPETGIIILTLLDTLEYRRAALSAGADAFVPKAVLTTELVPAIRQVAQSAADAPLAV